MVHARRDLHPNVKPGLCAAAPEFRAEPALEGCHLLCAAVVTPYPTKRAC
jgi:hypothetical protein